MANEDLLYKLYADLASRARPTPPSDNTQLVLAIGPYEQITVAETVTTKKHQYHTASTSLYCSTSLYL